MRPPLTVVRLMAALLGAFSAGCAASQNYLAPEGPRLQGAYAGKPADEPALRIVTFNVEYGKRVEAAIEGLRSHPSLRGADVLLLQEMDGPGVDRIAQALGMNFVYFPASREPKGQTDRGNAILSPWPIEESRKILLPHPSRIIHRGRVAVTAVVTIDGKPVQVYCVHLGSPIGISGGKRRVQAEVVLADAERSPGPTIIAGDFNSHGIGNALVERGYVWATRSVGKTVGFFSFDHVFLKGFSGQVTAGVVREVNNASDHRPVWATLDSR
jgi:endonuclease/exonuclease/phosphatase family metal-dependent hydrolase